MPVKALSLDSLVALGDNDVSRDRGGSRILYLKPAVGALARQANVFLFSSGRAWYSFIQ